MIKLYPEGAAEARLKIGGVKKIFFYCNRDGLFYADVKNTIRYGNGTLAPALVSELCRERTVSTLKSILPDKKQNLNRRMSNERKRKKDSAVV